MDASETPVETPKATRRSTPRAIKELRKALDQIDALIPALSDKAHKVCDLLIERGALVRALISAESDAEETESADRIADLEASQKSDATQIAGLEQRNRVLSQAGAPIRVEVPEPLNTTAIAERDLYWKALEVAAESLTVEDKAEIAARSLIGTNPNVGKGLTKLLGVDHSNLVGFLAYDEPELLRIRGLDNRNSTLAAAVLAVRFPDSVKSPTPVTPQPRDEWDSRSPADLDRDRRTEEAIRAAKASIGKFAAL